MQATKIPLYNGVNEVQGYTEIAIHTPQEVMDYENEGHDEGRGIGVLAGTRGRSPPYVPADAHTELHAPRIQMKVGWS